jgi:hypothetical protein
MKSSLNFKHLENLMKLPCFIDGSSILIQKPIIATGIAINKSEFRQYVKKGESLSDFLKRIYHGAKKYDMDCSIYAQLISLVLSDKWPKEGGQITLYIADEISGPKLWNNKISEMGYIGNSHNDVATTLSKLPITFKGQWVIQIDQNNFIGLTDSGPIITTMEEWVTSLRTKLLDFSTDYENNEDFEIFSLLGASHNEIASMAAQKAIAIYFRNNKMNKWGFYTRQNFSSIKAKWTPEEIKLKYK